MLSTYWRQIERLDTFWREAAGKSEIVFFGMMFAAFLLFGFALFLGLHSVQFDGRFKGGAELASGSLGVVKEVGFFFAPNWLLTGLLLSPFAIRYLFRTRSAIEPLLTQLVARGMIVRADGSAADEAALLAIWRRHSVWWTNMAIAIFVAAVAFTVVADFIPVVLSWTLASPESVSAFVTANAISLGHPTYEFDWSIASTFAGSTVPGWVNAIFAGFAYLLIPVFGSATMFAAMVWLFSTHSVFNARSLEAEGYKLVPDINSDDERCGFEVFEDFFENLVWATFIIAMIVVSMHLQNVYLRSPDHANIIDMVFGSNLNDMLRFALAGDIQQALQRFLTLQTTMTTLGANAREFSAQTYVALVALLMLAVILFGMVWGWLRSTARKGQDDLLDRLADTATEAQLERLEDMKIWPIGWAGLTIVIASIAIVAGCMIWTNFLYIVMAFLIALAIKRLIGFVSEAFTVSMRRKKRRSNRRRGGA